MPISSPLTQGGQTLVHKMRMLRQIFKFALACTLMCNGLYAIFRLQSIPTIVWKKSGLYLHAKARHTIQPTKSTRWQMWQNNREAHYLKSKLQSLLQESILVSFIAFTFLLLLFWIRGKRDRRMRHNSGQQCVSPNILKKQIKRDKKASSIQIGPLPIVKGSETQHFLITGTTGTGKTNCLHQLLPQIRHHNHKAVIIDTTGIFVQHYFKEGRDLLLNPFDARSKPWNPWAECLQTYHYKEVAKSLIPQTSHDPFWSTSAQTIFSIILEYLQQIGERSTKKLLRMLLEYPLHQLFEELSQNASSEIRALSLLDPKSEKTATSIRSSAASYVDCLSYLEDAENPFSIRNWIQDDSQTQWLFLSMLPDQRDTLRPLISTWASTAIKGLLGKAPNEESRTWFIFDELASLHQLHDLTTCLAESRKYGGAAVLGIQNLGQLDELYGPNTSKAIVDLCSTKVCFRQTSPDLAYRMAKAFGEKEIIEMQEGISYGANDVRDGVNLSMQTKDKLTVPPTEIFSLENLEAFVKLAGNYPVAKVRFPLLTPKGLLALPFLRR